MTLPKADLSKLMGILNKYRYALLVLAVGAALMTWPTGSSAAPTAGTPSVTSESLAPQMDDLSLLEQRLSESLSAIRGVGKAEVVLTLQAGSRQILAEDTDHRGDSIQNSTLILSAGSGTEKTVVTQVIAPVFQGALVVCDGGGEAQVRLEVLHAVSALTGLRADRISISERQTEINR